ncbi:MAG: glycosyltransferase family 2 protein [Candidatus Omnitrophica bacterium]|nr:glycosyltransferase family 2 protein [Candidatus Omnitrophota bacterium]MDD5352676.1 glycosyltransferase family 2 protein [Candidatus Omnitrophota bacterium]MDD5550275.1 glycosyltransferase family 2 protein [Candidatus Omnitrophota bacterium]
MSEFDNIEVSIVMPCLNEEETVGICIKEAKKVLGDLAIRGEIIVVDNGSSDNSVAIAQKEGAKVVFEPEKGYGSAYLRGFKEVKGEIIVMADADNTYDFSEIGKFISSIKQGYDFVIGSRFKGEIKKGAMPWANRYIGNPILSGVLRFFFNTDISDAHCGIRAFTDKAYKKMELHSLGMEFASEMVIAAIRENLKIKEIPVSYLPRKGKSKLVPLRDAWRHFNFMLIYSPTWLYLFPGIALFLVGLFLMFSLLYGPIVILGHLWDVHIMVLASLFSILGVQIIMLGLFAKTFGVISGFLNEDKTLQFMWRYFKLEKGIFIGIVLFMFGFIFNFLILSEWTLKHFGPLERVREAVLGATFIIIGIQTIFSSFFLHMLGMKTKK